MSKQLILPRNVTVTIGGVAFQTKMPHNYTKTRRILEVGKKYISRNGEVEVLQHNLYGVTLNDGEYACVYRNLDGALTGYHYFTSEVIDAEAREWSAIQCGARG